MNNTSFGCIPSTPTEDVIAVTIWGILLLYGLVTNILTLFSICQNNSLRSSTSYWLILCVALCDTLMIMISLIHLLPATYFHEDYVEVMELRNALAIFLYNIFWYTGVLSLFAMAVNRFVSIIFPTEYPLYFSPERTRLVIVGLFIGGFIIAVPALFDCCHTIWNHHCFYTAFKNIEASEHYGMVDLVVCSTTVVAMLVCYSAILIKVRQSRLHTQRHRGAKYVLQNGNLTAKTNTIHSRELRLFIQFFVVSVIFTATFITWQVTFRFATSGGLWLSFVMTGLFFVNNGTNPTVYIIFNPAIRGGMAAVLYRCCPLLKCLQRASGITELTALPNGRSRSPTPLPSRKRSSKPSGAREILARKPSGISSVEAETEQP